MTPATIALIISLVEEAIKIEPAVAAELEALFSKPNPTPADWETLRSNVLAKTYADYVPASALPSGAPAAAPAAAITLAAVETPPITDPGAPAAPAPVAVPAYLDDGTPNPAHPGQ